MRKIKIAVVGYGNLGREALRAVRNAADMELSCLVRRETSRAGKAVGEAVGKAAGKAVGDAEFSNIPVVSDIAHMPETDVAVLCLPTHIVEQTAPEYLSRGISTVDSYDFHPNIPNIYKSFDIQAKASRTVSILAAGWDPGSDSVIRALFQAMAPNGITYTNFGPGMSMGHSVAVKAIPGVRDALAMTIPMGAGVHKRMVYIELEKGADFENIKSAILSDKYFVNDQTHVYNVASIEELRDTGHGVLLTRKGVSAASHNQQLSFEMRIHNPALTAQIMVSCARAATRRQPGCYTMIQLPIADMLPGDAMDWITRLV